MSKLSRAAKKLARMSSGHQSGTTPTAAATAAEPPRTYKPAGARPTGPRTPEGKAISSQNARKHGLTSATIYIPEDLQEEYDAMASSLQNELQPQGALETTIFENLLRAAWNMYRIDIFEDQMLTCPENFTSTDITAALDRYQRYHTANERSFYKALKELQTLQTNRAHRASLATELPANTPLLAKITVITKRTPRGAEPRSAEEPRSDFPPPKPPQSAPAPECKTNSLLQQNRVRSESGAARSEEGAQSHRLSGAS
jgi:hypothetical protein